MDSATATALLEQHVQLLIQIQRIWIALAVIAFLGLLFVVLMFVAAAWSVNSVKKEQRDLAGKFSLLIDVLLQKAREENAAREAAAKHGA